MGLYIGKVDRRWLSRVLLIMLADIIGIMGSYLLALWARFDFHFTDIPQEFVDGYLHTIWWWVPVCLAVFWLCNLYNSIWRFVSVDALMRIILAYVLLGGLSFACVALFGVHMPRSYYVWGLFFSFFCTSGIRFFYRGMRYLRNRAPLARKGAENVMIIGAGQAGRQLIREYAVSSHLNSRVACIIDDNPAKRGRILEGVRVVGARRDIPQAARQFDIDKIVFAIPSLQGAGRQEILNICSTTGCQIQVVPGMYQLVNGEVTISKLRRVELQDLLGRDPIQVNLGEICGYINDKTVLVTGGGGSIGSELCRQIARHSPRRLVIFDIYENNAYDIQMELRREHPELTLEVCIGSVRDQQRVDNLLDMYRPDLIFHAAAHKHVPLMEDSRNEAIKNNVFGTYKMARAAARQASLALLVLDGSRPLTEADREAMALARQVPNLLVAVNKADLPRAVDIGRLADDFDNVVSLSARSGQGVDVLCDAIQALYPAGEGRPGELLTNARQADAVSRALAAVRSAREALRTGMTPDVVLTDAETALEALGELNGKHIRDDLIQTIFSRFCVGK